VDTQLPRLYAVTMTGQAGTPEASVVMPVASYEYGSVVDPSTGQLTYQLTQTTGPMAILRGGVYDFGIGYSKTALTTDPHPASTLLHEVTTPQQLIDLNGDGRMDLFSQVVGGVALNTVSAQGSTAFPGFPFPFVPDFLGGEMSHVLTIGTRLGSNPTTPTWYASDSPTVTDTLRQLVDVNGDGRVDVLEAPLADPDHWVLHLNTPDPTTTFGVKYVDVHLPVARMRAALATTGSTLTRVPLGRRTTGYNGGVGVWT
jgi:hypothetical protein